MSEEFTALPRHLDGRAASEVAEILLAFASAALRVRSAIDAAPLTGQLGLTGATNVQNETTAKLDDVANDIFTEALRLPGVARLISEEEPAPLELGDGAYTCCFDPLDGSSNIGVSSVGSVLGIYTGVETGDESGTFAAPVTGRQQVAAAFVVYGLPAVLVIATEAGVDGFACDPNDETWRLAFPSIQVPPATYTSINWTYRTRWSQQVTAAVDAASEGLRGRYSGSMVEDVWRVLMCGGIFLYPEDSSSTDGKLRMLYEVCPIGLIMEAAGGGASAGAQAVLDVPVTTPHQRGPLAAGTADTVERYAAAYRG